MKLEEPEDRISFRARAWMGEARRTYRRFEQDKVWVDAHGEEWEIDRLETSHLLHIIPFLEKKAHRLAYLHGLGALQLIDSPLGPTSGSEAERMAEESLQDIWELQIRDPLKWLRSTPLMKRLYKEKRERELDAQRALLRARYRDSWSSGEEPEESLAQRMENLLVEVLDTMNRRVWFPYELQDRIAETLNETRR